MEDNNNDVVILKDDDEFGEGLRVEDQPVVQDLVDTARIAQQVNFYCFKLMFIGLEGSQ